MDLLLRLATGTRGSHNSVQSTTCAETEPDSGNR